MRVLLFHSGMRALQDFVGRTHVDVVAQFNAEHCLGRQRYIVEFGRRFAIVVGLAMSAVNDFRLRIVAFFDQIASQAGDQLRDGAPLGLGQWLMTYRSPRRSWSRTLLNAFCEGLVRSP
jgi:hypothetical protein